MDRRRADLKAILRRLKTVLDMLVGLTRFVKSFTEKAAGRFVVLAEESESRASVAARSGASDEAEGGEPESASVRLFDERKSSRALIS
jgi:hypothetical protein